MDLGMRLSLSKDPSIATIGVDTTDNDHPERRSSISENGKVHHGQSLRTMKTRTYDDKTRSQYSKRNLILKIVYSSEMPIS